MCVTFSDVADKVDTARSIISPVLRAFDFIVTMARARAHQARVRYYFMYIKRILETHSHGALRRVVF